MLLLCLFINIIIGIIQLRHYLTSATVVSDDHSIIIETNTGSSLAIFFRRVLGPDGDMPAVGFQVILDVDRSFNNIVDCIMKILLDNSRPDFGEIVLYHVSTIGFRKYTQIIQPKFPADIAPELISLMWDLVHTGSHDVEVIADPYGAACAMEFEAPLMRK